MTRPRSTARSGLRARLQQSTHARRWIAAFTSVVLIVPALGVMLVLDTSDEELADACITEIVALVDGLQGYVDGFADISAQQYLLQARDEADAQLRDVIDARLQSIEALDCDDDLVEGRLRVELQRLRGQGTIATAVADALRASVLGQPQASPQQIEVSPDEDLAAIAIAAPAGSTLLLEDADYFLDEPLLVAQPLRILGASGGATSLTSSADEATVVVLESGALDLASVSVTHEGAYTVAVVLLYSPAYALHEVDISGGTLNADGAGGTGLLIAPRHEEPMNGLPGSDGLWDGSVRDSAVHGNAGAGVVVVESHAPTLTGLTVHDNGLCGVCMLGASGGVLRESDVRGNGTGLVVGDAAAPVIEDNTVLSNASDGVLIEGVANPMVAGNVIRDNAGRGVVILDGASPTLFGNAIVANAEAAIALGDDSNPTIEANTLTDHDIGVWVEGDAQVAVGGNTFDGEGVVRIIVGDDAQASIANNTLIGGTLGVEMRANAVVEIVGNTLRDIVEVAIVLRGASQVSGGDNNCVGSAVGIVLLEQGQSTVQPGNCTVVDER